MNSAPGPVIVDVAGTELTVDDIARLSHPLVGGVILFARNYESRPQLAALCRQIRGRVQRFREGFTQIAPMRELGELWDRDVLAACKRATEIGRTIGAELREVGVDLSFTPVLDLDHGPSGVIGDRALHRDPRVVTLLAKSLMHGLLLSGAANCGKHFPGHGYARADSHVEVPVDDRDLATILADDAAPYAWLGETLLAVMPAHVIYPKVDPAPAGFSRRWLQTILRRRLGFRGMIFSDDLSMEGAAVAGGIVERAQAALTAGCDMILVCNQPAMAEKVLGTLQWKPDRHFAERFAHLRPRG